MAGRLMDAQSDLGKCAFSNNLAYSVVVSDVWVVLKDIVIRVDKHFLDLFYNPFLFVAQWVIWVQRGFIFTFWSAALFLSSVVVREPTE